MTFEEWLSIGTKSLQNCGIQSARLDALLLLEFVTTQDKAHILAHPEAPISKAQLAKLSILLDRRCNNEPIAYLLGKKEFYGRDFAVTKDVLIPRPESESFLELLKKYPPKGTKTLLDIGTGSGILAISAKKEFPATHVCATDVSKGALRVAATNAKTHGAAIKFVQSDLLANVPGSFDYIFANLPYVPNSLITSPEITKEPPLALFAGDDGLECIRKLIAQLPAHCATKAYVCIESLAPQHKEVATLISKKGFQLIETFGLVQLYRFA